MPPEADACLLLAALAATGNTSTPHRLIAAPLSRLRVKYRPLPLHTYIVHTTAEPQVQHGHTDLNTSVTLSISCKLTFIHHT